MSPLCRRLSLSSVFRSLPEKLYSIFSTRLITLLYRQIIHQGEIPVPPLLSISQYPFNRSPTLTNTRLVPFSRKNPRSPVLTSTFQMRDVLQTEELEIPEGVDVSIKSRLIAVSGPRGKLTKNVRHVNMDIRLIKGKSTKVTLAVWQGGRKHVACLRTIRSLINNMITGVTKVCPSCLL